MSMNDLFMIINYIYNVTKAFKAFKPVSKSTDFLNITGDVTSPGNEDIRETKKHNPLLL